MDKSNVKCNLGLFLLGLMLAFGIIFGAYFVSSTMQKIKLNSGTITVKGYAEKKITSDFVKWNFELNIPQNTLKDAYAQLEMDRQRLLDYLLLEGLEIDQIDRAPVSMSTIYRSRLPILILVLTMVNVIQLL